MDTDKKNYIRKSKLILIIGEFSGQHLNPIVKPPFFSNSDLNSNPNLHSNPNLFPVLLIQSLPTNQLISNTNLLPDLLTQQQPRNQPTCIILPIPPNPVPSSSSGAAVVWRLFIEVKIVTIYHLQDHKHNSRSSPACPFPPRVARGPVEA